MSISASTMSVMVRPTFRTRPLGISGRIGREYSSMPRISSVSFRSQSTKHSRDTDKACFTRISNRASSTYATRSMQKIDDKHFQISEEVKDAIEHNTPVVALETTIYTHGFPYPDNVDLALDLEATVRQNGGIPATIGIIDGIARVGLSKTELRNLASMAGKPETMKVSRRDLPYILGMGIAGTKLNGGTTIAGTSFLAKQAGIQVFGTGGLGGVHRGGQDTMDISADLTELGRTAVAVISSGCKSFLDIPRTLEYLETQGVGVFTFADGRRGEIDYPAFYTRESGVLSPMVVQNAKEAAAIIYSQMVFPHSSGLHFANPIPEEHSIPKSEIDAAIDQAVREAAEQGIHGHANTPFILARIKDLTKGNSIPANRALIQSNVTIATKVAVELSRLRNERGNTQMERSHSSGSINQFMPAPVTPLPAVGADSMTCNDAEILVFGSVAIDLACNYSSPRKSSGASASSTDVMPRMHTSNIATITPSIGGVGHNLALAAQLSAGKAKVQLQSLVAEDLAGSTIMAALKHEGLDTRGVVTIATHTPGSQHTNRTAQYVAINDAEKNLFTAMADMELFDHPDNHKYLPWTVSPNTKWIVVDSNWAPKTIRKLLTDYKSKTATIQTAFEPVSAIKSARIFTPLLSSPHQTPLPIFPSHIVDLATPNQHELASMYAAAVKHEYTQTADWWRVIDALGIPSFGARDRFVTLTSRALTDAGIPLQTVQLLPFIPTILTKLGSEGVLMTALLAPDDPRLFDPASAPYILSRTSNGSLEVGGVYMRLFPARKVHGEVVSVNGVGDTFLGVLIAGLARGLKLDEDLIDVAQKAAVLTLMSANAVSLEVATLKAELDILEK